MPGKTGAAAPDPDNLVRAAAWCLQECRSVKESSRGRIDEFRPESADRTSPLCWRRACNECGRRDEHQPTIRRFIWAYQIAAVVSPAARVVAVVGAVAPLSFRFALFHRVSRPPALPVRP